ncbi:MAG: sulfate ABC transporter permease subunit CysT [Verrucomicrobiota bacterium]
MSEKKYNPLPGFGLTMGYTIFYLSALVLIPVVALFLKAFEMSWADFWKLVTEDRALAAYRLTFGAACIAALINAVMGTLLAWVLVRYEFPGKRFIDALVDFPFALPTAVAGLTLSNLFAANGWLGKYLVPFGIKGSYTPLAVVIALTFVGLPFAVRTLQPVLQNLEKEIEEVAASLGASRFRTFWQVLIPTLFPTIVTGFALAFARAVGEYGSIVFVSGNLPFKTEIAPYLIVIRLEQYDYHGAVAIAAVLMIISFVILAVINWLEVWASRFNQ